MRYYRISDHPCDAGDCPALFRDSHDHRRVIARGDLLPPTDEIVLEDQERAVVVPALHVIAAAAELGGELTRIDLGRMFRLFAADAFRIETRDHYDVAAEAPAIAEFEATGQITLYPGKQDWLDLVTNPRRRRTDDPPRTHCARLSTQRLPTLGVHRAWQADAWAAAIPLPEFVKQIRKAA
ncbi:MAG: DUF6879 family protein [Pseudonocardiaceae bacterium]